MTQPATGFENRATGAAIGGRRMPAPLTLMLRPDAVCGIIGRNAAGKSGLLKLLAGQLPQVGGAAPLDGTPLAATTPPFRGASASGFGWR